MSDVLRDIDVMILCGGLGSRISRHLPQNTPKCLAPINGRPFLDLLVNKLRTYGAQKFILCAGHMHEKLQEWAGVYTATSDGVAFALTCSMDGPMRAASVSRSAMQSNSALIVNGDTWIDGDLGALVDCLDRRAAYEFKVHGKSAGIYFVPKAALEAVGFTAIPLEICLEFDLLDIGTPGGYAQALRRFR